MDKISSLIRQIPPELQQRFIANAVHNIMQQFFPTKYAGLCHIYAIVGSNILSIALGQNYIPVAGIGIIDAGNGRFLKMLDNAAFSRKEGGMFHCWIESADLMDAELVDFSFKHNAAYALTQGIKWCNKRKEYLWGLKSDVLLNADQSELPKVFPDGKVWFRKTDEGVEFLENYVTSYMSEHIKITTMVLKYLSLELEEFLENNDQQASCGTQFQRLRRAV